MMMTTPLRAGAREACAGGARTVPLSLFAQNLLLTSRAYLGLGLLAPAEDANLIALKIAGMLKLGYRVSILLVTTELAKKQRDITKVLATRQTIYELLEAEESDPYVVTQVSFLCWGASKSIYRRR